MYSKIKKAVTSLIMAASVSLGLCSCSKTGLNKNQMAVYFFQAGKADAQLIYTDEMAVLIDAGDKNYGEKIAKYLDEKGITKLDALILTHYDEDHIGGVPSLLDNVLPDTIYVSNLPKDSKENAALNAALEEKQLGTSMIEGDNVVQFELDGVKFTIDGPDEKIYEENDSNNSSLITEVEYNGHSLLFMGDAQKLRAEEYMEQNQGKTFEVLKVPHHGYYHKYLKKVAEQFSPEYAIITCSNKNGGEEKSISAFEEKGAVVLKTCDSPVYMVIDDKITVKTET
ncbi:MAG: MBL fold metallo-hydrolase [Oscillospiraceae bacterium]|nr:MBL fold metallo-hydrolase [Oscillospiraceae bacterium]